jgi:hypothetical protein
MFASSGSAALRELTAEVRSLPATTDDSERIERIRLLEELKSVAAAVQAEETARFVAAQRAEQVAAGVAADRVGRGIAAQLGLARRISPWLAQRYAGWAGVLTAELPTTYGALRRGRTSEWRAMLVARETAWLSREHRGQVDAEIGPRLEALGDRRVEAETKKLAYRLDPAGYVARIRGADNDRRVGLRPAPELMCRLTGLLPVAQGVAAYAALGRMADSRIACGDARSRSQLMADAMIERLTGQVSAADVPVEINLIMTDETLLADRDRKRDGDGDCDGDCDGDEGGDEPAHLLEYGPIPAELARRLVLDAGDHVPMWLRRLYRHPDTGQLAAMDCHRRRFSTDQRHFLRLRDQQCRTPWCNAPIRHIDHINPFAAGGPTTVSNGQGYCQTCNHAKQAPGWSTQPTNRPGEVVITTPTRHRYQHRPPDPPGTRTTRESSPLEQRLAAALAPAA